MTYNYQKWGEEETDLLITFFLEDIPYKDMGLILNRSFLSVQSKLLTLGFKRSPKGRRATERKKEKISQANKGRKRPDIAEYNKSIGHREIVSKTQTGKKLSEETREKIRQSVIKKSLSEEQLTKLKKVLNSPEYKKKHKEAMNSLIVRKKLSKIRKRLWQNEDYVRKQMKSNHIKPNKAEKELEAFLTNLLPNEYKYVGDGEVIIHGKCPDFININGQKKIIEFYGRYWHPPDDEPNRQFIFSLFGYKTLIVWDNEFNDLEVLREKILGFNKC